MVQGFGSVFYNVVPGMLPTPAFPQRPRNHQPTILNNPPTVYNSASTKERHMTQYTMNNSAFSNNFNTNSFNVQNINVVADDRSPLLNWLSPLEPKLRHRDIQERRIDNVGEWLLQTKEFKSWHDCGEGESESDKVVLFCYGGPGVGKTFIR